FDRIMPPKKPFILLEILIAIALLALAAPFLGALLLFSKKSAENFQQIERQRGADLALIQIRSDLLAHPCSWEELPKPGEKKGPFSLPHFFLASGKKIERAYFLRCLKTREKESGREISRLLDVEIELSPLSK